MGERGHTFTREGIQQVVDIILPRCCNDTVGPACCSLLGARLSIFLPFQKITSVQTSSFCFFTHLKCSSGPAFTLHRHYQLLARNINDPHLQQTPSIINKTVQDAICVGRNSSEGSFGGDLLPIDSSAFPGEQGCYRQWNEATRSHGPYLERDSVSLLVTSSTQWCNVPLRPESLCPSPVMIN